MDRVRLIHDNSNNEAFFRYNEQVRYYLLKEDEYRKLQKLLNTEGD